jgi:hypothetical protein
MREVFLPQPPSYILTDFGAFLSVPADLPNVT